MIRNDVAKMQEKNVHQITIRKNKCYYVTL